MLRQSRELGKRFVHLADGAGQVGCGVVSPLQHPAAPFPAEASDVAPVLQGIRGSAEPAYSAAGLRIL